MDNERACDEPSKQLNPPTPDPPTKIGLPEPQIYDFQTMISPTLPGLEYAFTTGLGMITAEHTENQAQH